jgi:cholesterol transport system auxiliary component
MSHDGFSGRPPGDAASQAVDPEGYPMRAIYAAMLLAFALIIMLLNGCVGANQRSAEVSFYTLEYESHLWNHRQALPVIIHVQRFAVAPFYRSDRMLYREKVYQRDTYYYHRWRVNPGDLVTYLLVRDMRQSGLFKAVTIENYRPNATHFIEGTLDDFYEQDGPDGWKAVLSMSITLVNGNEPDRDLAVLFQNNYTLAEPCERRNPQAVAQAMSAAMAKLSHQIISDVYAALNPRSE